MTSDAPVSLQRIAVALLCAVIAGAGVAYYALRSDDSGGAVDALRTELGLEPRPPERHELPAGFSGWATVEYGVEGAAELSTDEGVLVHRYPESGRLETATPWRDGLREREFVAVDPHGEGRLETFGVDRRVWDLYEQRIEADGIVRHTVGFFIGDREQLAGVERPTPIGLPDLPDPQAP